MDCSRNMDRMQAFPFFGVPTNLLVLYCNSSVVAIVLAVAEMPVGRTYLLVAGAALVPLHFWSKG